MNTWNGLGILGTCPQKLLPISRRQGSNGPTGRFVTSLRLVTNFCGRVLGMLYALVAGGCGNSGENGGSDLSADSVEAWSIESGIRMVNATASCTLRLSDDTYRTYLSGITTATSPDGLTWSVLTSVGLAGGPGEFLRNPAVLRQSDGTYLMIYEGVTNNTNMKFYRATSSDGVHFTKTNGALTGGAVLLPEVDENNFIGVPDLVPVNANTLRLYFVAAGDHIETATSSDTGSTWTREGPIILTGHTGGSQQVDPDAIVLPDGGFRLFYATPPSGQSFANLRIHSALSSDGRSFTVEAGARINVETSSQSRLDPDVVLLPAGNYRMYFGESPDPQTDYDLRSAISP